MKTPFYIFICACLLGLSQAQAQTTILTENFSGGTLPSGWTTTKNSSAVGWQFGNSTTAIEMSGGYTYFAPQSRGNFAMDLDLNNNDTLGYATEDRLITPSVNLSSYASGSHIYIGFSAFFEGYYNSSTFQEESLTVEASTNGGSSWTPVKQAPQSIDQWQDCFADISSYAGQSNVMFAFHYNDGGTELIGAAVGGVKIFTTSFVPSHVVTFEEGTGTWCGFCPRGIIFLDSMENIYPTTALTVSVHNNDIMTLTDYDAAETAFWTPYVGGWPAIAIDRLNGDDPSDCFAQYANHINNFAVADLTVSPSYNSSTRLLTVNCNGHFATDVDGTYGGYTYVLVLTENNVQGNSSSYDQSNYYSYSYSGGAYGSMSYFDNLPEQVPYTDIKFQYVARAILGAYGGTSGSIPTTVTAGSNEPYTFTYTVPASYNATNMAADLFLIDQSTGNILNAKSAPLIASGISELNSGVSDATVYPNPINSNVSVAVSLSKEEHVVINITDILGRTVATIDEGTASSGSHLYSYDASSLSTGTYFMTIKTNDGQVTRKVVKAQ